MSSRFEIEWSPRVAELAAFAPYLHIYNINKPIEIQIPREIRGWKRDTPSPCQRGGVNGRRGETRGKRWTSIDANGCQSVNDNDGVGEEGERPSSR